MHAAKNSHSKHMQKTLFLTGAFQTHYKNNNNRKRSPENNSMSSGIKLWSQMKCIQMKTLVIIGA